MNLACNAIITRSSCRSFTRDKNIESDIIERILYAGTLAPSGKNMQPWRFKLLNKDCIEKVSCLFKMSKWFRFTNQAVAVFMDAESGYDTQKDAMSMGACVQNMLIEAECNGVGACWIGEFTNYKDKIEAVLSVSDKYILMAIVALGYPLCDSSKKQRKPLSDMII